MGRRQLPHLSKTLVLNRYMLSLFGVTGFDALAEHLKDSILEGRDENNISKYHHQLKMRMLSTDALTADQLLQYDENITRHTQRINRKRIQPIEWKYFQYLSLLFTEIYLDKFFRNREHLLEELNEYLDRWNKPRDNGVPNESGYVFTPFAYSDLNKLAFWSATGSGKTLLMHVNILQFEYWRKRHGQPDTPNILLVTPNEGLSAQHLTEFAASDLPAYMFSSRTGKMFAGKEISIIEISKLADETGDKTIDHTAFETKNLVLIDEGHRGVAGDAWKRRRDYLSSEGFAFEYSATFGQAVAATSNKSTKESLLSEYSKTILFDYSYRYFYGDGYGKDYRILNVPTAEHQEFIRKYLTGALLTFYQQKKIASDNIPLARTYNIEDPLWIFVGGTVTSGLSVNDKADIPIILQFFAEFVNDSHTSVKYLEQLLEGRDGLLDTGNRSIFKTFFNYLQKNRQTAEDLYRDILKRVFNSELAGAALYADNLKGASGELGLRIGNQDYFGVINIGADADLFKLLQEQGIPGIEKDFSDSLFKNINEQGSKINLLIGAKKFTEGWSSWRVSCMGLMNVGQTEGSQIIQLFGRGVRLKGYGKSLKRSSMLDTFQRPDTRTPTEVTELERLNIFGIRSTYMEQFKSFLEEEGLPQNDGRFKSIMMPVMPNVRLGEENLKILTLKEGIDFKKDRIVKIGLPQQKRELKVHLDWYPKVQVLKAGKGSQAITAEDTEYYSLKNTHLAFINWDQVWFELQRYKNEKAWYNLSIDWDVLPAIMKDDSWYQLAIPEDELIPDSFKKTMRWQEVVIALLKGYVTRWYNLEKSEYLGMHMKTVVLDKSHPNFFEEYEILIEENQQTIIRNLEKVATLIREGSYHSNHEERIAANFTVFDFMQHLYKPLLSIDEKKYRDLVTITPTYLNSGELKFARDLKQWYLNHSDQLKGKKLFLLRNQSRKGVGFFEAHGFYPDFMLWKTDTETGKQHIAFIDPKGLRQVNGFNHPKLRFYKTIKETIQQRIDDKEINLSSFIVSVTTYDEVRHWEGGLNINNFTDRNVYFREEQQQVYIGEILAKMEQL